MRDHHILDFGLKRISRKDAKSAKKKTEQVLKDNSSKGAKSRMQDLWILIEMTVKNQEIYITREEYSNEGI
jgi:hypothetical protein